MGNTNIRSEEIRFQGLLDRYLNHQATSTGNHADSHLDEDSLSAFVEGNLSEREAAPIVSHLVDCSFCRHVTADLSRLDLAFADEPAVAAERDAQPSKVSEVLGGLLSRLFGTSEGAVFAHEEREDEKTPKDESDKAE